MFRKISSALFAALCVTALSTDACTSWVLHRGATRSGMMILHKVLDQYPRNGKLTAGMRVAPNGWRWMCIGNPNYAMNEKGVAMTTNDGDPVAVHHPGKGRGSLGPASINRIVMTSCSTAEQGVAAILHAGRGKLSAVGGIYFITDPERAFMININHGYAEVAEIKNGAVVITNTWHLPGGEEYSTKNFSGGRNDRAREANTRMALRESRVDGKYTVRGSLDTSRRTCGKQLQEMYPFRKMPKVRSLSSVCFELDREFPAYLSCAYIAQGPQQHTLYLPTPMALRQFPEEFRNGTWSRAAFDHQEAVGSDHGALPRMRELEDKFIAEFAAVRDRARLLLREKKTAEAVKLLNDCYFRQYAEAREFLRGMYAGAGKKAPAPRQNGP